MSKSRSELIQMLSAVVIQHQGVPASEARDILDRSSTTELADQFYRAVRSGTLRPDGSIPAATQAPTVTAADVEQAKQQAQLELEQVREAAQERTDRARAEVFAERELHKLRMERLQEPQRKAEAAAKEARAREIFALVCRQHNLSECKANFRLLFDADLLDSEYTAAQAIASGVVTPAQASAEEFDKFQQERIEQHNQKLLSMSPLELRAQIRRDAEARRTQSVAEAQAEADRARQARDAARNYSPLPETRNGQKLNSSYIKRASKEELRFLILRFGESAVVARLRQG